MHTFFTAYHCRKLPLSLTNCHLTNSQTELTDPPAPQTVLAMFTLLFGVVRATRPGATGHSAAVQPEALSGRGPAIFSKLGLQRFLD